MKYSKEERLEIGRRIYAGEVSATMAAREYDINYYTAREYLRYYKAENNLAIPKGERPKGKSGESQDSTLSDRAAYEDMSREELIDELIRARINEERAKKGYTVKGVGAKKEFIPIGRKNTK